jgi:hypothetical protein
MKSKAAIAITLSLSLLGVVQTVSSATAAPGVCKKAGIASVNTSDQTLYSGDSLRVTFRGIGGGCDLGNFKVIVSSSSDVNKQGYIGGIESNVALSAYPSGSDTDYQRVTYTYQISDSDKGKFFQYFFVTSSGVKVRSVIVEVSDNSL